MAAADGLWPQYSYGGWPSCCRPTIFDGNKISRLKTILEEYWPSLIALSEMNPSNHSKLTKKMSGAVVTDLAARGPPVSDIPLAVTAPPNKSTWPPRSPRKAAESRASETAEAMGAARKAAAAPCTIAIWALLLVAADLFGAALARSAAHVGKKQREFDYFALALQWPGTICASTRHCCAANGCCR
ncbi:hypothetical protein E2562_035372 [Oryza meyeriana var. granulata]|uniref:Uncharacterized protein n=1 Tax=Oryza meyeriana var. granulata TaxID=110450 RepID=A0A6G1E7M0_9ORYZ|nr:hypothetical protein E2562_035372 [Oryza meyeriana var. granulata]